MEKEDLKFFLQNYISVSHDGYGLLLELDRKKQVEEMDKQRTIFVNGCKDNNIKEDLANKIFNLIETFAGYGFNKSHSAAYALLSFQTAYLKTYYPEYFMAAVLSSAQGNTDKISSIIKECKDMNISVLSPNILTSGTNFFVNPKKQIEYGLTSLKGVAESFIYHPVSYTHLRAHETR